MKKLFFLFFVLVFVSVGAELVEVGSADLSFSVDAQNQNVDFSAIKTSLKVFNKNDLTTNLISQFDFDITPSKIQKYVKLLHRVKPKALSNWNPSNYWFVLSTDLVTAGQYVEFRVNDYNAQEDSWSQRLVHWEKNSDFNYIIFNVNRVYDGNFLFFNSYARNFSKEKQKGFDVKAVAIKNSVVYLVFKTNVTSISGFAQMGDLVTKSTGITTDTIWGDGNTYYVTADGNFSVLNSTLTIQKGAVIKFKNTSGSTYLRIDTGGKLVFSGGTGANTNGLAVFTSQDDDTFGVTIGTSDGVPARPDYLYAINLSSNAATITTDANDWHDINVSFAQIGLLMQNDLGNISNSYFQDNNAKTSDGGAISIAFGSNEVTNINNNSFSNNYAKDGAAISMGGYLGNPVQARNIFDNNFLYNKATANGGAIFNKSPIDNVYNNLFIGNSANSYGGAIGATPGFFVLGNITNLYNNVFQSNSSKNHGGAVFVDFAFTDLVNNTFENNSSDKNGDGVFVNARVSLGHCGGGTISNWYNNILSDHEQGMYEGHIVDATAGTCTGKILNQGYNAFWQNDVNCGGIQNSCSATDVNLTSVPFIEDGTDRNFLVSNTSQLQDTGITTATGDLNSFFQQHTILLGNRLDRDLRDIGYHYDQNGIYVVWINPKNQKTIKKITVIDLNVGYNGVLSSLFFDLNYSLFPAFGTGLVITKATQSVSCDGSLFPETQCHYSWNTTNASDGNFFGIAYATDTNLNGSDVSDTNFSVSNGVFNSDFSLGFVSQKPFFGNDSIVLFLIIGFGLGFFVFSIFR